MYDVLGVRRTRAAEKRVDGREVGEDGGIGDQEERRDKR